jgi:hypothetical protein
MIYRHDTTFLVVLYECETMSHHFEVRLLKCLKTTGWACSYDGGTHGMQTEFWWEISSKMAALKTKKMDNIKMDLRETDCKDGKWKELAQNCV